MYKTMCISLGPGFTRERLDHLINSFFILFVIARRRFLWKKKKESWYNPGKPMSGELLDYKENGQTNPRVKANS